MASGGQTAGYVALVLVFIILIIVIIIGATSYAYRNEIFDRLENFVGWNVIRSDSNAATTMTITNRTAFVYTGSGDLTLTIPADGDDAGSPTIGAEIAVINNSSSTISIVAASGVTIPSTVNVPARGSRGFIHTAANTWSQLFSYS